jgi:hypothetical protein
MRWSAAASRSPTARSLSQHTVGEIAEIVGCARATLYRALEHDKAAGLAEPVTT